VRCEDHLAKTAFVLHAGQGGYSIDTSVPSQTLTGMQHSTPQPGHLVLGLTQAQSRVAMGFHGSVLQDPASGYECIAPQIDVVLEYLPMTVFVGREFSPGSCAYDMILAHELRHVHTYQQHLPKVEARLRAALATRFVSGPLYAVSGQGKAALEAEVNTGWLPYIKAELGKVETVQAQIDTPQEYARLSSACHGEVQAVFHRH
jgi:hypothetical protein